MEDISMRERIKALTAEYLIRHGYHGLSFGNIAEALGTTRANIHYHFGNKLSLVEEVLADYVEDTAARFRAIWTDRTTSLFRKIEATAAYNRSRYLRFNPARNTGRPWSLIARMRQDSEALTAESRNTLRAFGTSLEAVVADAIGAAKANGELVASAPTEDIALQIVGLVNSAGPITQDAGNFERLEQLYLAFGRVIIHAYGTRAFSPRRARPSPTCGEESEKGASPGSDVRHRRRPSLMSHSPKKV